MIKIYVNYVRKNAKMINAKQKMIRIISFVLDALLRINIYLMALALLLRNVLKVT